MSGICSTTKLNFRKGSLPGSRHFARVAAFASKGLRSLSQHHLRIRPRKCCQARIAERFRGFEIDHEGKLARLLDREIAGPGASKEERHLVPSTLIRQNGCPNYIKFRMTLNGIQNRDLSWHTREMRHGRRRTAKTARLKSKS